ncbi:uncharacterized protein TNCV_1422911 [Trichonephila clavipes]|nr:uncharacterized protein TNCV_1422911 [Trichonephila clavipes]
MINFGVLIAVLYDLLWFINVNEQNIKKWAFVISLLKEDETDQAIEEPDEIMHRDNEMVRASDSRPEGLGSMLEVTKYPLSAHGFTCRNCGGGDRGRVAIYRPFGEVSLSLNRTVTCMANDRHTSCPCHDEFRGPRSD